MSQSPFSLENKTILVTGASSGIGRQVAISCYEQGANVVLSGRNPERLLQSAQGLDKSRIETIVCDLTQDEEIAKQFASIKNVDGIVHSAGLVIPYPIQFMQRKHVMETFNTNFIAPVLLTSFLLSKKKINKNGSIVFLSSISADYPYVGGSMYASSKAALQAFSKTLALELVKQKIRSNSIAPALIKTPLFDNAEKNMLDMTMDQLVAERYLLGVGLPSDVANMAIFLLSEASRWITGKNFSMDGGVLLSSATK